MQLLLCLLFNNPSEKNNRNHHRICFMSGFNKTCIGFNGNCNGGVYWSLLVIGRLIFVSLLKQLNPNEICSKTNYTI